MTKTRDTRSKTKQNMSLPDFTNEIASFVKNNGIGEPPDAAIILGSGLGNFAEQIDRILAIPYTEIPGFPKTSVEGHDGTLIYGNIAGKLVLAFSGRFHSYEGFSYKKTAIPVYLTHALNTKKLIITNAAGGINRTFKVGDLMIIEDIMRQNLALSPRRYPQFRYHHYGHADNIAKICAGIGINIRRGTYIFAKGPNYETKAEIRSFRFMGADAVGMSTVPELMEASRLHLKTVAISLISNMASGVHPGKLTHEEVSEAASFKKEDFALLVKELIRKW